MAKIIGENGKDLIKEFESWSPTIYKCPANLDTIGWGHVVKKWEHFNQPIGFEEGESLLKEDLKTAEDGVNKLVKVHINQNQFDALVSFAFNCGVAALESSTLLKRVNECDWEAAANEFRRWNKSKGKVLGGLKRRRKREKDLFLENT